MLLDLTHTSHTHARTGIQRVARELHAALATAHGVTGITWDHAASAWRPLEAWETANLHATIASSRRGAHWPWPARLRGHWRRLTRTSPSLPAANDGLIVPELFSPKVAAALPSLLARVPGPRIALFHDAIALKYPELTAPGTVARFPAYLQELLAFDGIAAISADSRDVLLDYWRWLGVKNPPPVHALPLGITPPICNPVNHKPADGAAPIVLSVGSLEGRKNHLALLDACEQLWKRGHVFTLHLIGLAHPQTGRAALARLTVLKAAGRAIRYDGAVDEATLEAAYAACTFTVYPSLMEGFGLPVLESLARGKPCICSQRGALGESARAGGCLGLDQVDPAHLAMALDRLLVSPADCHQLAAAARARQFQSWTSYAAELTAWMRTLPRR